MTKKPPISRQERYVHTTRNKPSPYLLDTAKVKRLKAELRVSDMDIAVKSHRTPSIVTRTILNQTRGIETQKAIAKFLGVPLEEILLDPPTDHTPARRAAA